jgi:predicted nucleic acid-binding protein
MAVLENRLKIYLDTSVISHLEQYEKPSEQAYSHALFKAIKDGRYIVYLSKVVFEEIGNCEMVLRNALLNHVEAIDYIDASTYIGADELANKIISSNILPKKSNRDCWHIAAAIASGCEYIISWNMKDMVNIRINKAIRHIVLEEGYGEFMLVTPSMLIGGDEHYE